MTKLSVVFFDSKILSIQVVAYQIELCLSHLSKFGKNSIYMNIVNIQIMNLLLNIEKIMECWMLVLRI